MKNSKAFFKVALAVVVSTVYITGVLATDKPQEQKEIEFLGNLPYNISVVENFNKYTKIQNKLKATEELETIREERRLKLEEEAKQRELERVAKKEKEKLVAKATRGSVKGVDRGVFTVTNYNLSVESCGKPREHPQYGLTASGYSLKGKSRTDAMTIAVDRKVIPMGSKVKIEFTNEDYSKYDGIYYARDTGGAIKGNKIDLFMGEGATRKEVYAFGKTKARITIIND